MKRGYDNFRVTGRILPGTHGAVTVDTMVPAPTREMATLIQLQDRARVEVGATYTRLLVRNRLQMSDTPDEYRDHVTAIGKARGRVLIHGLGLGCYLQAILAKPEVQHVDVVELSEDVLAYIGQWYSPDPRVHLHHDDAYTRKWPANTWWDCVWHDIWPTKNQDDLANHAKLLRSYGRRCGWQGAWAHEELQYRQRQDKAHAWWYE